MKSSVGAQNEIFSIVESGWYNITHKQAYWLTSCKPNYGTSWSLLADFYVFTSILLQM